MPIGGRVIASVNRSMALIAATLAVLTLPGVAAAQSSPDGVPAPDEAPIALLIDQSNGQVLHARSADRRFIPASITKVMTLFHAFELMAEGALSPSQTMTM